MVAYKPKEELLKSLIVQFQTRFEILIINNSPEKLDKIFYSYENVKVIDSKTNLGNGAGINTGIKKCQTNFILYMDIDTKINEFNFNKLLKYSKKIKDFGVLIPNGLNKDLNKKIVKRWDVEGSIFLINKNQLENKIEFDENYFLYFEENDFFFNCIKNKINVFFLPKVKFTHLKASSIETINNTSKEKLNLLREWHYIWSNYYFHKKNFSLVKAIEKSFPLFFKDLLKLFFYIIKLDKKKIKVRYIRICAFLTSFFNMKSSKRI